MQTDEQKDQHAELLFQYDKLRAEILHNDLLTFQILGATIVLVTAIFGIAFNPAMLSAKGKGFLFAVANAVTIIGMFQGIDRQRTTFLIASYMRYYLEPQTSHIKWETKLMGFRRLSPRKSGYGATLGYELITYFVLILASLILGIFFTWLDYFGSPEFLGYSFFWVIVLVFSAWLLNRARVNQKEFVIGSPTSFDPIWKRVDEEEEKEKQKDKQN